MTTTLPIPSFFHPEQVSQVWRVPYQQRAQEAKNWAKLHQISPASLDSHRIGLLLIDVQNTFCLPDFELFVGGKSGRDALEDNIRLCEFIYRNLNVITQIFVTLDTHTTTQIFHPIFWVNEAGENPEPMTNISEEDVNNGRWKVNPEIVFSLERDYQTLQNYALHYVKELKNKGKYDLTIWPYHGLLGGISYGLVSAVEEALFFHNIARQSQTHFEIKGGNPLTENYSVFSPEVTTGVNQEAIASQNTAFLEKILGFDQVIIAGQAKSHCVAWSVEDLLIEINRKDPRLADKIYLLEDCTSPVVVPNVVDFSDQADATFQRFAEAGMHPIKSTDFARKPSLF